MRLLKSILLAVLLVSFSSCDENDEGPKGTTWQLVWSDEFNPDPALGPVAPDESKWTYDIGPFNANNELQNYTNNPENVIVEDGLLKITALENFSSARVKTQGLFSQTYGRFEARLKTPYGPGIWPAFWLLGDSVDTVGWPECGEIDIMEIKGQEPNITYGSIHGPSSANPQEDAPVSKTFALINDRFDADFHIFAIEWGVDYIDFYIDETLYQRITPGDVEEWVFNEPFFIILNVAIGGDFVGFPTSNTPFPQTMEVDYIRVYKELN
ncbi:glycoside hydrolase family 16 protein [Flaviramulus aquimarinus]